MPWLTPMYSTVYIQCSNDVKVHWLGNISISTNNGKLVMKNCGKFYFVVVSPTIMFVRSWTRWTLSTIADHDEHGFKVAKHWGMYQCFRGKFNPAILQSMTNFSQPRLPCFQLVVLNFYTRDRSSFASSAVNHYGECKGLTAIQHTSCTLNNFLAK